MIPKKIKWGAILVFLLVVTISIYTYKKPFSWDSKDDTDFSSDNGNGGYFKAESTIELLDSKGQVVEASFIDWLSGATAYFGSVSEPTGCPDGYHWDPYQDCVPDEPVTTTQTQTIQPTGDIAKVKFTLQWAEVRGVNIEKQSLVIPISVNAWQTDGTWSEGVGWGGRIRASEDKFTFTDVNSETWIARTKEPRIGYIDITMIKANYKVIWNPFQLKIFYYAKGTSLAGETVESDAITQFVTIQGSSLSVNGSSSIGLINPFRRRNG